MKPIQRSRRRRGARPTTPRRGMSIVELMVAIVLLGVGLLSMAAFSSAMTLQQRNAMNQQVASMVVQSRVDSLSSIHCKALAATGSQSGTVTTRGVTERWTVADGNDTKLIYDTLTFKGRTKPLAYISVIPCRD